MVKKGLTSAATGSGETRFSSAAVARQVSLRGGGVQQQQQQQEEEEEEEAFTHGAAATANSICGASFLAPSMVWPAAAEQQRAHVSAPCAHLGVRPTTSSGRAVTISSHSVHACRSSGASTAAVSTCSKQHGNKGVTHMTHVTQNTGGGQHTGRVHDASGGCPPLAPKQPPQSAPCLAHVHSLPPSSSASVLDCCKP